MSKINNPTSHLSTINKGWLDISAMEWLIHSITHKRELIYERLLKENLQLRGIEIHNYNDCENYGITGIKNTCVVTGVASITVSQYDNPLFCIEMKDSMENNEFIIKYSITSLDGNPVINNPVINEREE